MKTKPLERWLWRLLKKLSKHLESVTLIIDWNNSYQTVQCCFHGIRIFINLFAHHCIISAFHEQISDESQVMLNGFGTVINCLGMRAKPYFSQIIGIIQWRLNNKSARVRQQAADLISRVALCAKNCGEESRLSKLGIMLYECLGEEYPEVLGNTGSINL